MKKRSKALLTAIIIFSLAFLPGCWNYREIDQLAIVAGVAIDRGTTQAISITVEIVEVGYGRESAPMPKVITIEGATIFDAVRHMVSVLGKKLYWSHAKVVVISREMAEEGVMHVLDWFSRDAETRADIHILISMEETAREILSSQPISENVVSYELDKAFSNQHNLHHAPNVEIWKFSADMQRIGITPITATVSLMRMDDETGPNVDGTAIFRGARLVGFLDGQETMDMLFVQDEIEGGVLIVYVENEENDSGRAEVTLEIKSNKTKIKPVIRDGSIEMDISTETDTAIDELGTTQDLITEEGRKKLESLAENMLKDHIEKVIEKAQKYDTDMFGFGDTLRKENPAAWSTVESDWPRAFKDLKVNVNTKVNIKNSAMLSKPLEVVY